MTGTQALWWILIFLALPLAGCIAEPEPADPAPGEAPAVAAEAHLEAAPPPQPTATTGALAGTVRSAQLEPLARAEVRVGRVDGAGGGTLTRTDAEGRFTTDGLAPGTHRVQVAALSYESAQVLVRVAAGEVTHVPVVLEPFVYLEPYMVRQDHEGFMAFGWAAAGAGHTTDVGDPNHDTVFDVALDPSLLETLFVRIAWDDAATVLEMDLWYNVTCSPCAAEHTYAHAEGESEILVRLDRPAGGWPGLKGAHDSLTLFVWPGTTEERPASVAYQVPFAVTFEAFYVAPAPPGYLPDPI